MYNGLSVAQMTGIAAAALTAAGRMSRAILIEPETEQTRYWAQEYSRHIELFEAMASNLTGRGVSPRTLRSSVRELVGEEAGVEIDRRAVLAAEHALLDHLERALSVTDLDLAMQRYLRGAVTHIETFVRFVEERLPATRSRRRATPATATVGVPPSEIDDVVYHFSRVG